MFPMGGDVLEHADGTVTMAWWGGDPWTRTGSIQVDWPNRVQGMVLGPVVLGTLPPPNQPAPPPTRTIQSWWTSSGNPQVPSNGPSLVSGYDLCNHGLSPFPITDAQALRLFEDPISHAPRVALNTPGARLIVLDTANPSGVLLEKSSPSNDVLDFGTGGMALATAPRTPPVIPGSNPPLREPPRHVDIYLGAMVDFADNRHFSSNAPPNPNPSGADDMTSNLVRVPYEGATSYAGAKLLTPEIYRLDGQGGRPKVYGVCGLAVVDILPPAAANSDPNELVVGALDGHLLVFERKEDGAIGQLLYQAQVEGAVGAYNSIQAHDLDGIPGNELYVATSFGLRRWIR